MSHRHSLLLSPSNAQIIASCHTPQANDGFFNDRLANCEQSI